MNRYSFETLELLKANAKQWRTEWNEVSAALVAECVALSLLRHRITSTISRRREKLNVEKLPTSFDLPPGAVAIATVRGKAAQSVELSSAAARPGTIRSTRGAQRYTFQDAILVWRLVRAMLPGRAAALDRSD